MVLSDEAPSKEFKLGVIITPLSITIKVEENEYPSL